MDLYDTVAQDSARLLTRSYSSSFGMASSLFPQPMRQHIYNIYGLVRVADEIVDTYHGNRASELLDGLEQETRAALHDGYSANIIVHAFQITARKYGIDDSLLTPFFASMRTDLTAKRFDQQQYERYIHGSAEVIGLMCLRVFAAGDTKMYASLQPGAASLGAAYQKVNFLRDLADDWRLLGRYYFPVGSYEGFDDVIKAMITADIRADFERARPAIAALPVSARKAVQLSYAYYSKLLAGLEATPAAMIRKKRLSVSKARKLSMIAPVLLGKRV